MHVPSSTESTLGRIHLYGFLVLSFFQIKCKANFQWYFVIPTALFLSFPCLNWGVYRVIGHVCRRRRRYVISINWIIHRWIKFLKKYNLSKVIDHFVSRVMVYSSIQTELELGLCYLLMKIRTENLIKIKFNKITKNEIQ